MTQEIWETLTPAQKTLHCWGELTQMLNEAMQTNYQAGNDSTLVVPGLTTLIDTKDDMGTSPTVA